MSKAPKGYEWAANDEKESSRLDVQATFFKEAFEGHLLSPQVERFVQQGQVTKILDVGTGTGIWCHQVAGQIQSLLDQAGLTVQVEIIGFDVQESALWQSDLSEHRNVTINIIKADMNSEEDMAQILKDHGPFDLVHWRLLGVAVRKNTWPQFIQRMLGLLRKGGYLQCVETDWYERWVSNRQDKAGVRNLIACHVLFGLLNAEVKCAVNMPSYFEDAGLRTLLVTDAYRYSVQHNADGSSSLNDAFVAWTRSTEQVLKGVVAKAQAMPQYSSFFADYPLWAREVGGPPEEMMRAPGDLDAFIEERREKETNDIRYRVVLRMISACKS